MADDDSTSEDEREVELASIAAIFPELLIDSENPFSASIELPVAPSAQIPVIFPESVDGVSIATVRHGEGHAPAAEEVHFLSNLPSIHIGITLPIGYPTDRPPIVKLSTNPQWLTDAKLEELEADGERLWEEFGHDQVVFAYIDHLQQAAENAFGVVEVNESLPLTQDLKIGVLDFDIKAKRAAFEKETFDCGICLDPKKGTVCHRMLDCGHVFCRECLQDFYNNAITEGDLTSVRCLAPDCAKKRAAARVGEGRRKPKTNISPSELLQIPLEPEMVKRYVTLKHKADLESDKNTIYCPRKWCQGAARSKKHRKPESLEESSDEEDEEEEEETGKKGYLSRDELLAICEDCSFAFCRRCYQGWHGEFTLCIPRTNTGELTEEDKASMEYLKLHTTPCPTCAAPAQKTHGCNHMICFRCQSHFCYLCSAWLEPSNPYKHFNDEKTGCYMRLWELEGGDGEEVGHWFQGGQAEPEEVEAFDQFAEEEEGSEDEDEDGDEGNNGNGQVDADGLPAQAGAAVVAVAPAVQVAPVAPVVPQPPAGLPRPEVEREAPLVLRLGPAPGAAQPAHPVAQAVPAQPAGRGGRGRVRGRAGRQLGQNGRREAAIARRMAERHAAGARAHEELNEADQLWVQRFVMAALNDEEDLIDDHGHDHEVWAIGADRGMDRRR